MKVPGGNGIQAIANDYGAAGVALAGAGVAAAPSAGGAVGASPGAAPGASPGAPPGPPPPGGPCIAGGASTSP
ncbi:MAG: hypothetical protein ACK5ES_23200, partial [Planctomyces sp.]